MKIVQSNNNNNNNIIIIIFKRFFGLFRSVGVFTGPGRPTNPTNLTRPEHKNPVWVG